MAVVSVRTSPDSFKVTVCWRPIYCSPSLPRPILTRLSRRRTERRDPRETAGREQLSCSLDRWRQCSPGERRCRYLFRQPATNMSAPRSSPFGRRILRPPCAPPTTADMGRSIPATDAAAESYLILATARLRLGNPEQFSGGGAGGKEDQSFEREGMKKSPTRNSRRNTGRRSHRPAGRNAGHRGSKPAGRSPDGIPERLRSATMRVGSRAAGTRGAAARCAGATWLRRKPKTRFLRAARLGGPQEDRSACRSEY